MSFLEYEIKNYINYVNLSIKELARLVDVTVEYFTHDLQNSFTSNVGQMEKKSISCKWIREVNQVYILIHAYERWWFQSKEMEECVHRAQMALPSS